MIAVHVKSKRTEAAGDGAARRAGGRAAAARGSSLRARSIFCQARRHSTTNVQRNPTDMLDLNCPKLTGNIKDLGANAAKYTGSCVVAEVARKNLCVSSSSRLPCTRFLKNVLLLNVLHTAHHTQESLHALSPLCGQASRCILGIALLSTA